MVLSFQSLALSHRLSAFRYELTEGQSKALSVLVAAEGPTILAHLLGFCNGQEAPREVDLPEVIHIEAASFDDALEGASRNRFASVDGYDYLPAIRMTPLLMAVLLTGQDETISPQYAGDVLGIQDGKAGAHGSDTSSSFAPSAGLISEGSNHSSSASLALRTASSSVSPAEAQPGSSGNTADHRLVSLSNSTSNRSFIAYPSSH